MPRELEDFRPYMEDILAFTGGRRIMTAKEAMAYTGRSRKWLNDRGLNNNIGAVQLARLMAMTNKRAR